MNTGADNITVIEGEWVVAHDGKDHRVISPGVVVVEGDRIVHVGKTWDGPGRRLSAGPRRLVMPGLISTHAHLRINEGYRMVIDGGGRAFLRSGFTNYAGRKASGGPTFQDPGNPADAVRYALTAHLLAGVTTVLELDAGAPDGGETVASLIGQSGIRAYYSPCFTAGHYVFGDDGHFTLLWDEAGGERGLEAAAAFVERYHGSHDDRLRGMLVLNEFFASTPTLRRKTAEAAARLGVGITTHFSEQLYEFHHTLRETGRTPVELLDEEGFLSPNLVLGHALYVAGHSMTAYPYPGDLERIAASGASVAHCPVAYARRGVALESVKRYIDAGINLSLGTDAFPNDIIAEMRMGAVVGKIIEADHERPDAADMFRAATTGGARALGRDDLGRLSPGAKADLVVLDFDNITIGPVIDPIRALVYSATAEMVEHVFIDGAHRVNNREIDCWDRREALEAAWQSANAVWNAYPDYHWAGKRVDEVFPPSFTEWDGPATSRH